MITTIRTTSGAVYELDDSRDGPGDLYVRRVSDNYAKRGDGDWQKLVVKPLIVEEGEPMVLVMESLWGYGGDDYGTRLDDVSPVTTRVTTPVVSVTTSSDRGTGS